MTRKTPTRAELLALLAAPALGLESGFVPGGPLEVYHNGELVEIAGNLVPAAARSYLLRAGVAGGAQISAWYGMPYVNDIDPPDNLTAANFNTTLDEFTNYTEGTRPAWVQEVESAQAIENSVTLMTITIGAGTELTMSGFALVSVSTKGNNGGTVLSAIHFADPRTVQEGDVLQFKYKLQAQAGA